MIVSTLAKSLIIVIYVGGNFHRYTVFEVDIFSTSQDTGIVSNIFDYIIYLVNFCILNSFTCLNPKDTDIFLLIVFDFHNLRFLMFIVADADTYI